MGEEADALGDDVFGGGVNRKQDSVCVPKEVVSDKLILKDIVSHIKHARKVATTMKSHGKIHWAKTFIDELIKESKEVLDADSLGEIAKTCNVIKNEKVQSAKRKVKGQAQKSKKQDKIDKAKKMQDELFGDSNQYDEYDEYGEAYEDAFF